jgi:hypothetical protein
LRPEGPIPPKPSTKFKWPDKYICLMIGAAAARWLLSTEALNFRLLLYSPSRRTSEPSQVKSTLTLA